MSKPRRRGRARRAVRRARSIGSRYVPAGLVPTLAGTIGGAAAAKFVSGKVPNMPGGNAGRAALQAAVGVALYMALKRTNRPLATGLLNGALTAAAQPFLAKVPGLSSMGYLPDGLPLLNAGVPMQGLAEVEYEGNYVS